VATIFTVRAQLARFTDAENPALEYSIALLTKYCGGLFLWGRDRTPLNHKDTPGLSHQILWLYEVTCGVARDVVEGHEAVELSIRAEWSKKELRDSA
jgi:hypothetical protein